MRTRMILTVCAMALASAALSFAGPWDRSIDVTFDKPVALPGVHLKGLDALPAGTYVFTVGAGMGDRNVVQIFNKDQTKVYATILTVPNTRIEAANGVVITFGETPAGHPVALHSVYYPGDKDGEQFVYVKK